MRALAKAKKDARNLTLIGDPSSKYEGFFLLQGRIFNGVMFELVTVSDELDSDLLKEAA